MTYDVIVVGARVAGSATAMLLARAGVRVLVVDRASFPSDTLSTHQVQVPGGARLARWGLLDRIVAAGTPGAHRVRFDQPGVVLEGGYPACDGVDAVYSPRRTLLDAMLVDEARACGAEVRQGTTLTGLVVEDGVVRGVRLRTAGGAEAVERAALVVGADGRRSLLARMVEAPVVDHAPARTLACYTYWSGVEVGGGEVYGREGGAVGAWPTNDGLVMTYLAWPVERLGAVRADTGGSVLAALDGCGDLGERVRAGQRAEPFRMTPETLQRVRVPHGPGWALAGDAGLVLDPVTGQGIGNALRDAELVAQAVQEGLGGQRPLADAMADFRRRRDDETLPMYEFTKNLARLEARPVEARVLFSALAGRQDEIDRFLGVLSGSVPMGDYFSPRNLRRVIGLRGFAKVALGRITSRAPEAA